MKPLKKKILPFIYLFQISLYTFISDEVVPSGHVCMLPHFGHFTGALNTVAIYSISNALNVQSHSAHLNNLIPRTMNNSVQEIILMNILFII